jgi:membrane-associated protein
VPYRTFVTYNLIGGVIWGVGYSLLGYLAGSAYTVIERRVGAGLAIAVAALVVAVLVAWAVRRHRRERGTPDAPGTEPPATSEPGAS